MAALSRRALALAAPLACAAGFFLASRGFAGEDERLVWELGQDAYRYDLEEDLKQRVSSEATLAPAFAPSQLVSQGDFDAARRFKVDLRQIGDLVWYYSLFLPEGEFNAKGSIAVDDKFGFPWVPGEICARGKDEVTRNAKEPSQATAVVTLALTQEKIPPPKPNEAPTVPIFEPGATLRIERTFTNEYKGGGPPPQGERRRLVTEAKFELAFTRKSANKTFNFKSVGKVALSGKIDATQKQFLQDVSSAIGRGRTWLKVALASRLNTIRGWKDKTKDQALGKVALPVFALLRSGVPPSELKEFFDFMETCEFRETYSVSLYVMALEARSVVREEVPAVQNGRTVARFRKNPLPPADKDRMSRAARWLMAVRKHGEGWWSYGGNPAHELDPVPKGGSPAQDGYPVPNATGLGEAAKYGDRSNSQFAALALHVAATSGVPVDWNVWKEVCDECIRSQEGDGPLQSIADVDWTPLAPPGLVPEGGADPFAPGTRERAAPEKALAEAKTRGWGYYPVPTTLANGTYGSMSGAGLMELVISREGLRRAGKLDKAQDEKALKGIRDGIAWFAKNWTPSRNPGKGWDWYCYYMYSVEKGMETAGAEKIGGHEWWREGAAELLTVEDGKKGRWARGGDAEDDTSFALLFLNRATLPATIVVQDQVKIATGDQDPEAWDQVFVDGMGYVKLRQVVVALENATTEQLKTFLKVADKAFDALDEDRRPRLVPDLIRLLALQNKDVHKFAIRALHASSGFEDETRARSFHARWSDLAKACERRDDGEIPKVRAILRDADAPPPLKRAACQALSCLRAKEAIGDLIGELSDKELSYRKVVATALIQLAGGVRCPYDPAAPDEDRAKQQQAWKEWWEKSRGPIIIEEETRRAVDHLAGEGPSVAAAEARLREIGKPAWPALVDGLRDEKRRERSHALLKEMTKQTFGAEPGLWLEWIGKN